MSKTASSILWSVTVSIYCVGGMLGGVSAEYWANKWGRYVHLLYLSQQIWGGIIICRRQLLQSYGQLLYPSTVLRNAGCSLCRILGQQMGQVCAFIIPITAYMADNYLSQTASTILWSVTVSIYCVEECWV